MDIYVGNLSTEILEDELQKTFAKYGKVQSATIVKDKFTKLSKGFGFITSDDDDDLFVHSTDLHISVSNQRLVEGQSVKFDIKRDMKGDRAINVKLNR